MRDLIIQKISSLIGAMRGYLLTVKGWIMSVAGWIMNTFGLTPSELIVYSMICLGIILVIIMIAWEKRVLTSWVRYHRRTTRDHSE